MVREPPGEPRTGHFRGKDASGVDWARMWRRQEARAPLADAWWRLVGGRPGHRIADVGCGPGWFALRYAALTGPTGHVHAVDADVAALRFLHAQIDPVHHAHVTFEHLDVDRAGLPDLAFDLVFATDVLHHSGDPPRALQHLRETPATLLVSEFDPDGPGGIGPPLDERLPARQVVEWLREAGWAPGEVVALGYEHYAVVARPVER